MTGIRKAQTGLTRPGSKPIMNQTSSDKAEAVAARPCVWLVDDNEEFRQGFGALLERGFGFTHIQHFGTAEAAIHALCSGPHPQVILLDLKLPGMDGAAAVPLIKAKSPDTRIFMFATYFDVTSARQALAAGANDYFTKRHRYEDVVAAICKEPDGERRHA
jgi:two-component system OmpR family response regulator